MKVKRLINTVLVILLLALVALGIRELYMFLSAQDNNNALKEVAIKVPDDPNIDPDDPFNRYIDFDALQSINPDIVGWIYIPDTMIDYPILVGETDQYYLNRDHYGNYSSLGSIFAYAGVDLTKDNHVCMFGHNMISQQMFGGLDSYKSQDYADSHQYCYIYTPDRTKECTLISAFGCNKTDTIFELDKTGDTADLSKLYEELQSRSIISRELPENSGQVFSLATCDGYSGTPNRFTTHFTVTREKYVLD